MQAWYNVYNENKLTCIIVLLNRLLKLLTGDIIRLWWRRTWFSDSKFEDFSSNLRTRYMNAIVLQFWNFKYEKTSVCDIQPLQSFLELVYLGIWFWSFPWVLFTFFLCIQESFLCIQSFFLERNYQFLFFQPLHRQLEPQLEELTTKFIMTKPMENRKIMRISHWKILYSQIPERLKQQDF